MNTVISKLLRADDELLNLLDETGNIVKINPIVPEEKDAYPYLTFEASLFQAGRYTNTYRCDINILTKENENGGGLILSEMITKRVLDLLHFKENNKKITIDGTTIHHSSHVGGGRLYDEQNKVYQQILIFNLKTN